MTTRKSYQARSSLPVSFVYHFARSASGTHQVTCILPEFFCSVSSVTVNFRERHASRGNPVRGRIPPERHDSAISLKFSVRAERSREIRREQRLWSQRCNPRQQKTVNLAMLLVVGESNDTSKFFDRNSTIFRHPTGDHASDPDNNHTLTRDRVSGYESRVLPHVKAAIGGYCYLPTNP